MMVDLFALEFILTMERILKEEELEQIYNGSTNSLSRPKRNMAQGFL